MTLIHKRTAFVVLSRTLKYAIEDTKNDERHLKRFLWIAKLRGIFNMTIHTGVKISQRDGEGDSDRLMSMIKYQEE